jgi:predicted RNA-binding protein
MEESIQNEHTEMVPFWERMIGCETAMADLDSKSQRLDQSISAHRSRLESLNLTLLNTNKQFLLSRQEWDAKGCGARAHLVEEAESVQEEFLRRVTVRDFAETVLFNMKVAIPEYKGKSSVRGIY